MKYEQLTKMSHIKFIQSTKLSLCSRESHIKHKPSTKMSLGQSVSPTKRVGCFVGRSLTFCKMEALVVTMLL